MNYNPKPNRIAKLPLISFLTFLRSLKNNTEFLKHCKLFRYKEVYGNRLLIKFRYQIENGLNIWL